MDIEQAVRKLEPLMPEQAADWRHLLTILEPDMRILLERQIRTTAYRVFGQDIRNRILLSLPPKKIAKGSFHLGTVVYGTERWPVGLSPKELTQHLAIFGRAGAGKTNVSFNLLGQFVKKRIPFLFLDWKRTARHLLPTLGKKLHVYTPGRSLSPFPFNPFTIPPGLDAEVYINHLIDVLSDAYTLGDGAKSILQRALRQCYAQENAAPTIQQVLGAVAAIQTKDRQTGWKISATRALESLEFAQGATTTQAEQQAFARSLLKQQTVIELDGLSQSSKKFLVPLLCYWLYSVQLGRNRRESLNYAIFLEEAHHTLYRQEQRSKETLMNVLLRQGRELGISFIVIDQHPHLISSAALGNCYATICMNLKDPTDINKAAGLSLVPEGEKRYFSMLPVGQGVVKLQDRWWKPFLVQFPLMDIAKGIVTDSVLAGFLNGSITPGALRERAWANSLSNGRSRFGVRVLEEGSVALLHDVIRHPDDGVDARYKRLGISADKGNRWKEQLIENDLLRAARAKVGRTTRLRLHPTEEARRLLRLDTTKGSTGSLMHEYWKRYYATELEKRGYHITLEAPRKRGRIDLLAIKNSERLAVEIETGKSDVVHNVKQDILAGCHRVIVVATDETALKAVERKLAKANLLIPSRVEIVLKDGLFEDALL